MYAAALNNEALGDSESPGASILNAILSGLKTMNKTSKYPLIAQAMPTDPRFIDRTGARFGRLVVMAYAGKRGASHYWACNCDCGASVILFGGNLSRGASTSCGCRRAEVSRETSTTHDESGSRLYRTWKNIRTRCNNQHNSSYPNYGGRGILLAPEFNDYIVFRRYVSTELGPRPTSKHSLDRIDNNRGYEPGNLRWATAKEQANNRRSNLTISLFGIPTKMTEVCEIFGLPYRLVMERINRNGWPLAKALTEPIRTPKVPNSSRGLTPN